MSAIPQKVTGEIHIRGGVRLQGKVKIQGSKNAALPILAATILAEGESFLKDCPKISDVYRMLRLLQSLGGHVRWEGEGVCIGTGSITTRDMPADAITGMRSSLCLLGALLARCGSIVMEYPGGCVIGKRPIDLHLRALEQMGVCFSEEGDRICGLRARRSALPCPAWGPRRIFCWRLSPPGAVPGSRGRPGSRRWKPCVDI